MAGFLAPLLLANLWLPIALSAATSQPAADSLTRPAVLLQAPAACPGNCNGDGMVTIDELIRGVSIALGTIAIEVCPPFDIDGNQRVEVAELVSAVLRALYGCDLATPSPPPSVSPTPTETPPQNPTPSPPNDLSGTYVGHFESIDGDGGSFSAQIEQTGVDLSGTVQVTGSPCFSGGPLSGTVSANTATLTIDDGTTRADVELTFIGSQAFGSYEIATGCFAGDFGTIDLVRQ